MVVCHPSRQTCQQVMQFVKEILKRIDGMDGLLMVIRQKKKIDGQGSSCQKK